MPAERIIAVDFGTSTSVVRVKRYLDGRPIGDRLETKPVTFNMGSTMVPTLVQKKQDTGESVFFGHDAETSHKKTETFRNFKVDIENPDLEIQAQARELTAEFFGYLAKTYRSQSDGGHLGENDDKECTIISYPVKWSEETKAFMIKTAQDAGFPNVEGLDEAQAAIQAVMAQNTSYLEDKGFFRQNIPANILLIDMGAGTTDLVLCRYIPGDQPEMDVLATWPQENGSLFGGQEMDDLLKELICSAVPEESVDIVRKKMGLDKFKAWKETVVSPALARGENVDYFSALDDLLTLLEIDADYLIDRDTLENFMADYLRQLPELISGCLGEAGLAGNRVDLVILTGGHSQWYFVRDILTGRLNQFGDVGLENIQNDPERIISISLPQETVALGLAYGPIKQQWKDSTREEIAVEEENAHAVLLAFGNYNDRTFTSGSGWIEFPIVPFGDETISVGQKCALYHEGCEDGKPICILPVIQLQQDGISVKRIARTEEHDSRYVPMRIRFAVPVGEPISEEDYRSVEWIVSGPITDDTYSEALFWYFSRSQFHSDYFKEQHDAMAEAFKLLVQEVSEAGLVRGYILGGKLDSDKDLYLYKRDGRRLAFSWSKAESNLHYSTFTCDITSVAVGDVIAAYMLPSGYIFSGEISPSVSWMGQTTVIKAGEKSPSDRTPVQHYYVMPDSESVTESDLDATPENEFELSSIGNCYGIRKYIGKRAHVVIPEEIRGRKVIAIEAFAFGTNSMIGANKTIESVVIPPSVTTIGKGAFIRCINLRTVIAHKDITTIEINAFYDCKNLIRMDFGMGDCPPGVFKFPPALKSIGSQAFLYQKGLTYPSIPREVWLSKKTRLKSFMGTYKAFNEKSCAIFYYDR